MNGLSRNTPCMLDVVFPEGYLVSTLKRSLPGFPAVVVAINFINMLFQTGEHWVQILQLAALGIKLRTSSSTTGIRPFIRGLRFFWFFLTSPVGSTHEKETKQFLCTHAWFLSFSSKLKIFICLAFSLIISTNTSIK